MRHPKGLAPTSMHAKLFLDDTSHHKACFMNEWNAALRSGRENFKQTDSWLSDLYLYVAQILGLKGTPQ
eukprot:1136123-Pelagomonas_calceolata.AAC.3